jgi:hypothetical protein
MKVLMRLLVVVVVLAAVLAPLGVSADRLPAPMEKKLSAGIHTINYAGQDLRFTTPVVLMVRLEPLSTNQIKLTVTGYGTSSGAQGVSGVDMNIYWENFQSDVYDGPAPINTQWTGVLYTESGFTEK